MNPLYEVVSVKSVASFTETGSSPTFIQCCYEIVLVLSSITLTTPLYLWWQWHQPNHLRDPLNLYGHTSLLRHPICFVVFYNYQRNYLMWKVYLSFNLISKFTPPSLHHESFNWQLWLVLYWHQSEYFPKSWRRSWVVLLKLNMGLRLSFFNNTSSLGSN